LSAFPPAKLRCANWSPTAPATSRSGPPPLAGPSGPHWLAGTG
jgi:hypothetical protein